MEKAKQYIKAWRDLPYGVTQCAYGVSILLTFAAVAQIAARL